MTKKYLFKSFTAIAAAATLVLAGCSADDTAGDDSNQEVEPVPVNPGDDGPETTDTPTQQSEEEREQIEQRMTPSEINDEQLEAVQSYLEIRENAESIKYDDAEDWEDAIEDVTTDAGLETVLESFHPGESSNARNVAQDLEYEVNVAVGGCVQNPGFGDEDADKIAVQCELTDLVKDDQGLVPSQDVDNAWPYYGEQDAPIVVIAKSDDKWLVDGDFTGKAS